MTSRWRRKETNARRTQQRLIKYYYSYAGRDVSVGTATRYGLDGPGIEPRWGGLIFRTPADRPRGPPSLLYNGYRVFTGVKRLGRDVDYPPHQAPRLKMSRGILLLLRPFVACSRVTFTFINTATCFGISRSSSG